MQVFLVFVLRSTCDHTPLNIGVQSRKVIELDPHTILHKLTLKLKDHLGRLHKKW